MVQSISGSNMVIGSASQVADGHPGSFPSNRAGNAVAGTAACAAAAALGHAHEAMEKAAVTGKHGELGPEKPMRMEGQESRIRWGSALCPDTSTSEYLLSCCTLRVLTDWLLRMIFHDFMIKHFLTTASLAPGSWLWLVCVGSRPLNVPSHTCRVPVILLLP